MQFGRIVILISIFIVDNSSMFENKILNMWNSIIVVRGLLSLKN